MPEIQTFTHSTGYSVEVRGTSRFLLRDPKGEAVMRWTAATAGRGDVERIALAALDANASVVVD